MNDVPEGQVDQAALTALRDWMIDGARPSARAADIINTMCDRLLEAGVPIERFALFIFTLHPNTKGRAFYWRRGKPLHVREADHTLARQPMFRNSIAVHVMETGKAYRCRFERDNDLPPFSDVLEIRDEGMTDYLIEPLVYTTGETHGVSWATGAPGGFSDDQASALESLRAPLARLTEIYMLRLNAASLLSAYVGRNSGRRVLEGDITRGDFEKITPAILFVDIKGFTQMTGDLPPEETIARINGFFDVIVAAVTEAGGEVLKFIGDEVLSIFPVGENGEAEADAEAQAVRAARTALERAEAAFAETPEQRLPYRAAIHVGPVAYGNIGGGDRLDFTAIGPGVNMAARLMKVSGETGDDLVCSAAAAAYLEGCKPLGAFRMKGIRDPQPVFSLPEPVGTGPSPA